MRAGFTALWLTFAAGAAANPYEAPPPVAPAADPFAWRAEPGVVDAGGRGEVRLVLAVPPGFFVYRDQIEVVAAYAAGLGVAAAVLPPGRRDADPADPAAVREVYAADTVVAVPITAPAGAGGVVRLVLDVRHQGCRPGLCYAPVTTRLEVPVRVRAGADAATRR